ncbi:hypothetical protein [Kitasatospora sp. NPDC097643]|uniref:hypothetical protein n=1 Tax=Kitasatospora sp. NPDC097643 TaxID=3157230 RepID=UPI00331A7B7F
MTTKAGTTVPRPETAHRPAPWVRTRLRSAPLAALLMAALAFVTVFLAAAFPRVADRGADGALREFVRGRGLNATSLHVTQGRLFSAPTAAELDEVQRKLVGEISPHLPLTPAGQVYGTRVPRSQGMLNKGYVRFHERLPPTLNLMYQHGFTDHATLTDGTWPGPAAKGEPLPIVLSAKAAETIHIKLGDVIDSGEEVTGPIRAKVVGFYRIDDPDDPFWYGVVCPARACLEGAGGEVFWKTGGFVDGGSLSALLAWGKGGENFWRMPLDPDALRADTIGDTRATVGSYMTGPGATALGRVTGRPDLRVTSFLPDVFARATARYEAAAPIAAIGPAGVAGVAAVVLCLAAALTADRRTAEIRLLRARGGSRGGVLLRLLGEGAMTVLPAAVIATALALALLPTPRWGGAVLAALVVTLLAVLAFPARAFVLLSRPRAVGGWRRVVGELAVLAVTAAAVAEVRRRGVAPAGSGVDPLLVTAPLLLALTGGLLLARIQPVVVGWLAALAGRGRGLVGFLGLARAARDTSGRRRPSVLPLLALLIAVTTAGFGATVLDTVDSVRLRAARMAVGGDAAVSVPLDSTLPEAFTTAAGGLPGARAATGVWIDTENFIMGTDKGSTQATLVVAEPKAYAEIARTAGIGEFDPALLAGTPGGPDTPVPALFSRNLADQLSGGPHRLRTPNGGELLTTVAKVVDGTPALPDGFKPFMVLPAGPAAERLPELKRVNNWFAVGDVDPGQLAALVRERGITSTEGMAKLVREEAQASSQERHGLPAGFSVRTSGEVAADLAADPLQRSAGRLFWSAVLAGAGFALLAVLLTLFRAGPDRAALLARLRTMGLRPRHGLALIIAETLPQTLAAAVGGGLTALAAVGLLGPAFDLSSLVGAKVGDVLTPVLLPVLLPTLGLALVVCAGVVLETAVTGRRQIATELRAGEQG